MMQRPRRVARTSIERSQKLPPRRGGFLSALFRLQGVVHRARQSGVESLRPLVQRIIDEGKRLAALDDCGFDAHIAEVRQHLLTRAEGEEEGLVSAFATAREATFRVLGKRHFDTQILGALAVYHGEIAEMQTGEGKTLTAILPAAAAALSGIPVHVLTVNDYLAARDGAELEPVYRKLGLSVGIVVQDTPRAERRRHYACDVVYCSNKEIAFDYMRDGLVGAATGHALLRHAARLRGHDQLDAQFNLRGLHFAIVDEADSVLLDDARTPLVISGEGRRNQQEEAVYRQALDLASSLTEGEDYTLKPAHRQLELTLAGEDRIAENARLLGPAWAGRRRQLNLVRSALLAQLLFHRDAHYLVRDDKVIIIDENTGRPMPDRNWEQGLHQLIEIKEGLPTSTTYEPVARMTLQRFFRMYHHLGGMTGTAREVAGELWSNYGLGIRRIPTHRPSRLVHDGTRVVGSITEKWACVAARAKSMKAEGRPVLIGTRTVGASEALSAVLTAEGLVHRVLNARQDAGEADIVATAGDMGAITIATNMAGRGTDIKLAPGVDAAGGLHIIVTELHESARLDRQLIGRSGRQGDPGSFEVIASLEDDLLVRQAPALSARLAHMAEGPRRTRLAIGLMRVMQWGAGRHHAAMRADLLRADERETTSLAFAGQG